MFSHDTVQLQEIHVHVASTPTSTICPFNGVAIFFIPQQSASTPPGMSPQYKNINIIGMFLKQHLRRHELITVKAPEGFAHLRPSTVDLCSRGLREGGLHFGNHRHGSQPLDVIANQGQCRSGESNVFVMDMLGSVLHPHSYIEEIASSPECRGYESPGFAKLWIFSFDSRPDCTSSVYDGRF
ncbi:hypothetical protein MSAN_00133800 [Mycena sanguinolenta]|uniref:Uncharacterized protein n=1 Tax=Mycena sanguinolenta TaxID=230812 RepID=A0A8H6ZG63_9AGAR|nr:hypothetical protein MSAN_00133800 [Mycena sanguinolenta]